MKPIRVLLIEDNRILREAVSSTLTKQPDFDVIAYSDDDLVEALRESGQTIDVAIVNLEEGLHDSLGWISTLRDLYPSLRVVATGVHAESHGIFEFVRAGGAGFVLRDATLADLVTTIRAVHQGERVLPSVLTKSLFQQIAGRCTAHKAGLIDPMKLTSREREIIQLVSEGLSNKEIAQRLFVATYTVKSHIHHILEKLGLNTRLQLAAFAHAEKMREYEAPGFPVGSN